ncbi:hypothetical protein T02_5896 [Trichinella nativa]|uniref:Uncharacterized protein n=1 Tax=Trichinella nativa TaxID=6335 RepID=A0A0V1JRT1_9BILA|nr:hypothetical protein T02_5896 [Trichinella nativa]
MCQGDLRRCSGRCSGVQGGLVGIGGVRVRFGCREGLDCLHFVR